MRILGIDPGSRITGYGIVQLQKTRLSYVTSGVIKLTERKLSPRLRQIYTDLSDIIQAFEPNEMAVEQVFIHRNPQSALKLGQARGVAMLAGVMQSLAVAEYSARQIKQAVVGYGNAEKKQVQTMVQTLLRLDQEPSSDAADALAAAMCHGQSLIARVGRLSQAGYAHGRVK